MTYQPFIIKEAEEILELLKDDVKPTEMVMNHMCQMLTQKFIEGKFNEGSLVFESEEECNQFINECLVLIDIEHLHELGLVGTFDDGESFFITEAGKQYVEQILTPDIKKEN